MLDKVLVEDFVLIWRHRGFLEALRNVRAYVRRTIYYRSGIENFLRYYLDTDGKNTILWAIYKNLYSRQLEREIGEGIEIMSEDWDNLIILDACRYEEFEREFYNHGELSKVVSKAHESWGFMKANFVGKSLHDTVYVTANPFSPKINNGVFYKMISLVDRWDDDIGTIWPSDVTEVAFQASNEFPDKRIIVHFMQPHAPHLSLGNSKFDQAGFKNTWENKAKSKRADGIKVWSAVKNGLITDQDLYESYVNNLQIVKPFVHELITNLKGKTVVTADHGENLGESRLGLKLYGHSHHTNETRFVPWLEIKDNIRKEVATSQPIGDVGPDHDIVNRRLSELGYL
jgi:hypothetical protein